MNNIYLSSKIAQVIWIILGFVHIVAEALKLYNKLYRGGLG